MGTWPLEEERGEYRANLLVGVFESESTIGIVNHYTLTSANTAVVSSGYKDCRQRSPSIVSDDK